MSNVKLREARIQAHLSQTELARRIRETGFASGDANGCTVRMVQRWESGETRRPRPHYLIALENVLGQPIENLGFDADLRHGMDRARALTEAGLDDAILPLPEPAGSYEGLTGIWLSTYEYHSSGRDATFTSRHYVMLLQRGARLMVRSLPASESQLSMDLGVNGQVITGTWTERTQEGGYYRGAVYTGAIQLLQESPSRMAGKWVGFGKEAEVNTGAWSLTLVDEQVHADAVERWNRPAEVEA